MSADRSLDVFADLHVEVGDDRGFTHLHLSGGPAELMLDIDDPAVVLRSGVGQLRGLQRLIPEGAFGGVRVRVRSDGRALGGVRFTDRGGVRARPTPTGIRVLGGVAARTGAGRAVLVAFAVALTAVVTTVFGRRR